MPVAPPGPSYGNQRDQASPRKVCQSCRTLGPRAAHAADGRTKIPSAPEKEKKIIGYGLPCARCHAYYPADMHVCPICKSPERVSPTAPVSHSIPATSAAPPASSAPIDDKHARLLKRAQVTSLRFPHSDQRRNHLRCVLEHQHSGATEPAAVCHSCYSEARQQADRMEAAFHIDAKEAAKIVYEAVWADTSDSNRTYLNAANALLAELRKRAGIGLLLGANQSLSH